MLLSLDTCSVLRLQDMRKTLAIDLRPVLQNFRLIYTKELKKEYSNYNVWSFFNFDLIFVPLSDVERNTMIKKYLLKGFDPADQDLVILGIRDKTTLITNDRDLFNQSTMLKIPTFQLWSFCLRLVKNSQMTKNEFHRCWKLWENEKRYSKKTLKLMKKNLTLL